ncbi:hypothetical protein V6N13_058911 [Hibiscus sabdariffa]
MVREKSSEDNAQALFHSLRSSYDATPINLKMLDEGPSEKKEAEKEHNPWKMVHGKSNLTMVEDATTIVTMKELQLCPKGL